MKNVDYLVKIERITVDKLSYQFGLPSHWIVFEHEDININTLRNDDNFIVYEFTNISDIIDLNNSHNTVIDYLDKIIDMNNDIDEKIEEEKQKIRNIKNEVVNKYGNVGKIYIPLIAPKKIEAVQNSVDVDKDAIVKKVIEPVDEIQYNEIQYNEIIERDHNNGVKLEQLSYIGEWNPKTNTIPNAKDFKMGCLKVNGNFEGVFQGFGEEKIILEYDNIVYSDGINWKLLIN